MLTIFKLFLIFSFTGTIAFADDLPSVHQIYETAKVGDLAKAHKMIEEVLKAHPQSAKAHFLDAEILVREGDLSQAKSELAEAERLSPGLSFAKPESVQHIKQRIARNDRNTMINTIASHAEHSKPKPFPWMMAIVIIGALLLFVFIIKSMFSRQNNTAQSYPATAAQGNSSGYPGGQSYPQSGGGLGSNMMSGLATGVAAGAGIVAGEALIHHFMDNSESNNIPSESNNIQSSDDSDFGVTDSSSWTDDSASDNDSFSNSSDDNW